MAATMTTARYLEGLPPVSHPAWCDPELCLAVERGTVRHQRFVGQVVCPPAGPGQPGTVVQVELMRCDNVDDGEWVPVVGSEVFVSYETTEAADGLMELGGPAAGRLGELLTIAWRHITGPVDLA